MFKPIVVATSLMAVMPFITTAHAKVSANEAAQLGNTLTPLGGEMAANKDGSIPAWNGGYTQKIAGEVAGGRRADPFGDEKPLFSITSHNMEQYSEQLTDGVKAMLAKYPDTYRLDVYPTHRTAAAPQWVYDNTLANAKTAVLKDDKLSGAYGGIPFPIPKSGAEVMMNHLLHWRGTSWKVNFTQYQLTSSGDAIMTTDAVAEKQMPYYFRDGSAEEIEKQREYWMIRLVNQGPPIRAGEALVGRDTFDEDTRAWVYLKGQRRVRKLPNPCCDTPTPATAGLMFFDEIGTFTGRLDRFDWNLIGKKELYIPYNNNRLLQPQTDAQVISDHHLNPDYLRWEKHRVWVVEATLAKGKRHQVSKSRYYCDEDTWACVLADRWDANGKLWRTLWTQNLVAPDFPGTVTGAFGMNDLISGNAFIGDLFNEKANQYEKSERFKDRVFTPAGLTGKGIR